MNIRNCVAISMIRPNMFLLCLINTMQILKIEDMLFSRDIIEPFLYLKSNERISNQRYKASVLRQFGKYLYLNNVIENIYI